MRRVRRRPGGPGRSAPPIWRGARDPLPFRLAWWRGGSCGSSDFLQVHGQREAESEEAGERESNSDTADASGPAKPIEGLAQDRAAEQAAEEVAREVDAAGRAAISRRRAADEAGSCGL